MCNPAPTARGVVGISCRAKAQKAVASRGNIPVQNSYFTLFYLFLGDTTKLTTVSFSRRNRALSIRSSNRSSAGTAASTGSSSHTHHYTPSRKTFSLSSLRGTVQPELSKRLFRLIKSENNLVSAHETAAKERISIATQLSEWGEQTNDDAISDVSDKIGVLLSEMGEQEDNYAHALDESRGILKTIRNTEKSVQPSRDGKNKIADEIMKIKSKEPESTRLVVLEQELVRAEAENLVAEAQLTNIVSFYMWPSIYIYILAKGGVC